MRIRSLLTFRTLFLWVVVMILGGDLFAPASAVASCGEYLTYSSHPLPATADPSSPLPHQPCDGPFCQAREPEPFTPAPASPNLLEDDRMMEGGFLFVIESNSSFLLVGIHELNLTRHPLQIDPPPRSARD